MNKTNIVIGTIASLALLGVIWLGLGHKTQIASFGNTSIDGSQTILPNPSNYDYLVARLALGLGTNLSNSNTGAGNLNIAGQRVAINTASTTVCAIQNPLGVTSTIMGVYVSITGATSSAATYGLGTTTTQYGTSTNMTTQTIGASSQGIITWDPGTDNSLIGPNAWFTVGNAPTGVFYPYAASGFCGMTVESAN